MNLTKTTNVVTFQAADHRTFRILRQGQWFGTALAFACGFHSGLAVALRSWSFATVAGGLLAAFVVNRLIDRGFRKRMVSVQNVSLSQMQTTSDRTV